MLYMTTFKIPQKNADKTPIAKKLQIERRYLRVSNGTII